MTLRRNWKSFVLKEIYFPGLPSSGATKQGNYIPFKTKLFKQMK